MKLDSTEARSSYLTFRHGSSSFPLVGLDPDRVASAIADCEFATGYVVLSCAYSQELMIERVSLHDLDAWHMDLFVFLVCA